MYVDMVSASGLTKPPIEFVAKIKSLECVFNTYI